MRVVRRFVWRFILLVAACDALHATVRYTVTLTDPVRHLIHVSMEIPAGRDSRELQLPVWNALYQVRDFAQFMDKANATDLGGHSLPLVQLNKSRWSLSGAKGGAHIEYEMFANDPGPYGAELNRTHAFFNLAEILLYSDDTRRDLEEVDFRDVPVGWKIATSLAQEGAFYRAKTYDDLVDAPVEIGTFQERDFKGACGNYRVVVDSAEAASILNKIVPSVEQIVNAATAWMDECPFQTYTFVYHFSDTPNNGGMEHAYSTAITIPMASIENDLDSFTSVTAHEFFHLWNVKRLRPQSLYPVDYTRENYTTALWFSEGVDSTVADLIRLKAGLLDESGYLYRLSQGIRELQSRPARLTQSVEQSSLDAWLEKYSYYDRPDRSISYYNKGELLGVMLDLKLREATHEKQSLQTLFRWMNENYAKQGRFFADSDGVRGAAEKLSGADFREFFADYVSGVREIPWDAFFAPVGLHVVTEEVLYANPGFDAVQKFDRPPAIVRVQPGSAADQAGAKADDEIVSINGRPAGRDFGPQIDKVGAGAIIHLTIRRAGEPLELQWTLGERRIKIYRLEDVPAITSQQRAARASWLSGVAGKSNP